MRLAEIYGGIVHNKTYPKSLEIKDAISSIKMDCKQILSVYRSTNHFLYRGVKVDNSIFYREIRKDRMPISNWNNNEVEILQAAYIELGIAANRQNSIFTSNEGIASGWGNTYIVFPTDPFQFSYFDKFTNVGIRYPLFALMGAINPGNSFQDNVESVKKEMTKLGVTDQNLESAIHQGHEVLITGEGYYGIKQTLMHESHLRKLLYE